MNRTNHESKTGRKMSKQWLSIVSRLVDIIRCRHPK